MLLLSPSNTSCRMAQQYGQVDCASSVSFAQTSCSCTACSWVASCHAACPLPRCCCCCCCCCCCSSAVRRSQLSQLATSSPPAVALPCSSLQHTGTLSMYWLMTARRQDVACTKAAIARLSSSASSSPSSSSSPSPQRCPCCTARITAFPWARARPLSCTKSTMLHGCSTCSVNHTYGISTPTPSADVETINPPCCLHACSSSVREATPAW
jgi:hypothetical protein